MLNNIRYDPNAEKYIYDYINWFCDMGEKIINRIIFNYDMNYINKKLEYNHVMFYDVNDKGDKYTIVNLLE